MDNIVRMSNKKKRKGSSSLAAASYLGGGKEGGERSMYKQVRENRIGIGEGLFKEFLEGPIEKKKHISVIENINPFEAP